MKTLTLTLTAMVGLLLLSSSTQNDRIDQIRTWYKEVEGKLKDCQIVEVEGDYVDGAAQMVTGWFDPVTNQFLKVDMYMGWDHHEETAQHYLHNGELFFTFVQGNGVKEFFTAEEMDVDEDTYYESGMEVKTYEGYEFRYYYEDSKTIRALEKRKTFRADDEPTMDGASNEEIKPEYEYYEEARLLLTEYLELLKEKQGK